MRVYRYEKDQRQQDQGRPCRVGAYLSTAMRGRSYTMAQTTSSLPCPRSLTPSLHRSTSRLSRPRQHYRLLTLCPAPTDPVGQSGPSVCIYVCMCIHTYITGHMCARAYVRVRRCACTCTCTCTRACTRVCVCYNRCIRVCTRMRVCACLGALACVTLEMTGAVIEE